MEQEGRILVYDGARVLETPFLDIVSQVNCCHERGLLGLAFHPEYGSNGLFYVNYIDRSRFPGDSIISRFQVSDDPNIADAGSEVVLLTVNQPAAGHNAGQLEFGPDGFLYLSLGDGGLHDDPIDRAHRCRQWRPLLDPRDEPFCRAAGCAAGDLGIGLEESLALQFRPFVLGAFLAEDI